MPVQGLPAYHLLNTVARVQQGQSVLVHAAAGGVGVLAVQLAKALGARVFGTVSSEAKARLVQEQGGVDRGGVGRHGAMTKPSRRILLKADRRLDFGAVREVLELARAAGARGVAIAVVQSSD